jgi:hypothetical protein
MLFKHVLPRCDNHCITLAFDSTTCHVKAPARRTWAQGNSCATPSFSSTTSESSLGPSLTNISQPIARLLMEHFCTFQASLCFTSIGILHFFSSVWFEAGVSDLPTAKGDRGNPALRVTIAHFGEEITVWSHAASIGRQLEQLVCTPFLGNQVISNTAQ